jgi:hypothetical protein
MSDQDRDYHAKANDDATESTEDVEAHVKSKHANDEGADEEVRAHVKSKHANDEGGSDDGDDVEAHVKGGR